MSKYKSLVLLLLLILCCATPSSATTITVDAAHPGLYIPREIYGNNTNWVNLNSYYVEGSSMPASLFNDFKNIGMGSFRYPGGCIADNFEWEKSIGPKASRQVMWINGCKAPGRIYGPAFFGVDEFLRLCEQLATEPQLTLEYRPPDKTKRTQADTSYTIVTNTSGQIAVNNFNLDDGSHLSLPGTGDSVKITFSIIRDGYHKLNLRQRAGDTSDSTKYWKNNAYSYQLDGGPVTFTGDISTLSAADSGDLVTRWGTTRSNIVYLRYGTHELLVTAQQPSLKLDYIDVQELGHDNSVKRAKAWVAYCNGDPNDTRSIGIDAVGVNWHTVGYWAQKRVENGHPLPYAVKFWEVGNEPWGPDPYGTPDGKSPTDYSNGWKDYYNAITAIDPALRLSFSSSYNSVWSGPIVMAQGDKARYFHFHPYFPMDTTGTDPYTLYLEGVTASTGVQNAINQCRDLIISYWWILGNLKGSASEWSTCFGWGVPNDNYAVRMTGVLGTADQLGAMTLHTDIMESAQFWAMMGRDDSVMEMYSGTYFKHGIYEPLKLFGNYFGDRVLPVTVSSCPTYYFPGRGTNMPAGDYPMLSAYASQDSSNYYLIVVNKDTMNAQSANLTWQGLSDATNRVTVHSISSTDPLPNYTSINTATSAVIRTVTTNYKPYQSSVAYSFPACSITGFVIEKAKPENLVWYREAEDIATVYTDAAPEGNIIATGPWNYESKEHFILPDAGDSIAIPFNIRKRASYTIRLKTRCGRPDAPQHYWNSNSYSYKLDGQPVSFTGIASTITPVDVDDKTIWGVAEAREQMLGVGRHYLTISANIPEAMIDWIEVTEERCYSAEAESNYSIISNTSGTAGIANSGMDSDRHVTLASGDVIDTSIDIPHASFYDVYVRVRSGDGVATNNLISNYNWSIDGVSVTATQDSNTISALDSTLGGYWMSLRLSKRYLAAGRHSVRLSYAGTTSGKLDYMTAVTSGLSVIVLGPTDQPFYITDNPTLQLSGGASDNVTLVKWSNSQGGSQDCAGTNPWNSSVPLKNGTNTITVTACNQEGLTTVDTITVTLISNQTSIPDMKTLDNGSDVQFKSTVSAVFNGYFYIENEDHSSGIRVVPAYPTPGLTEGATVCVKGKIYTNDAGERYVQGIATVQP